MDGHSVLGRFAIKVSTLPPEEAKKVAMFWVDMDLVEHALHITRKGYLSPDGIYRARQPGYW